MQKVGFLDYYSKIFQERWPKLCESLKGEPRYFTLREGLLSPYFLDEGSYIAASALPVRDGDRILDLCAAPGGKALVLASRLGPASTLTVNEKSSNRRRRLRHVLENHLPEDLFQQIRITSYDANKWGLHEKNVYDAILLDVPCSSERHILQSPKHLGKWSPARIKHLAIQAYSMLASAFMAVKPNGHILYATCALLSSENDEVVEKLLHRKNSECSVVSVSSDTGEKTRQGIHILPDRCGGMGPTYLSLIKKN